MHLTVCIWFCAQRAERNKVGITLNQTFHNFLYRVSNWIRFLLLSPLVICINPSLPITNLQHFWNFSGIKYTCRNKQSFHLHSCAQSSKGLILPTADICSLLSRNSLSVCRRVRIWLICMASRVFYRRPLDSDVWWRRDRKDRGEPEARWDAPRITRENGNGVISLSNHDKHGKLEGSWNYSLIFRPH